MRLIHFMIFCDSERVEVIKVLIRSGIDVNHKTSEPGISALFWAGMMLDFIYCIKTVLNLNLR